MFTGLHPSSRRLSRALALLVTVTMAAPTLVAPGLARAQEPKAGVVTALQGQAVVARPVIQQPLPLKFKDDLFVRDRVETREDSLVRILLGGKALVTVRELSTFTVTEEPNRAVLDLRSGKAAVGVAPSLLRPGESIEVRTPNAVAGIRGSLLVVTVAQVGSDFRTTFEALQASKPITVLPLGATGPPVQLNANQSVGVLGTGAQAQIGPVTNMTPAQVQAAERTAAAPRPTEQAASSPMAAGIAAASMVQATQLVAALQGAPTPDALFQPSTITKAQGGGATDTLADKVTSTSQLGVNAAEADRTITEDPALQVIASGSSAPPAQVGPTLAEPPASPPTVEPPTVTPPVTPPVTGPVTPPVTPPVTGPVTPPVTGPVTPPVTPPVTGPVTPPVTPPVTGPVTPPVTPPVTGPVTPPVTPPVTGPVTPPVTPPVTGPVTPPVTPPVSVADVAIVGQTLTLPSGQPLKTFAGASTREATTPVVLIDQSAVTGDSTFIEVAPGSEATLSGPLLQVTNSEIHTDGNVLHLGSGILEVGASPALSFQRSVPPENPRFVNAARGVIRLDGTSRLTVPGSLLSAVGTEFLAGDTINNTFGFLSLFDGASIVQVGASTVPLLVFDDSIVTSAGPLVILRRSPPTGAPTNLVLSGPLFQAVNGSTFTTMSLGFEATFGSPVICCTAFSVRQGAFLLSSTTDPLIQLAGGSRISSGPSERSGSSFFAVADTFSSAPIDELVASSFVALQGPLVRLTGASRIDALSDFLDVTRSLLVSSGPQALIQLSEGSSVHLGGTNPFTGNPVAPRLLSLEGISAIVGLAGGTLLSAVDSTIESRSTASLVGVLGGASLIQLESTAPLISLTRGSLTTIGDRGGSLLQARGALAGGGSLATQVSLTGSLLSAEGVPIVLNSHLVNLSSGGQLVTTLTAEPLIRLTGGSFTGGNPGQTSGGSLLRMFSDAGTADTLLSVGRFFESQGAAIRSRDGSVFNIADGAVVESEGGTPFARFVGGSVTSDGTSAFMNVTNNSSFTVPGQATTVGNKHAPTVSIEGTAVEVTAASPGGVVVDAGGTFLPMTTSGGFPAPSMTVGGSLLAAKNATITTGNPTTNTGSLVFVGDGSSLRTTGTAPLLSFESTSVDTAGSLLAVSRSAFVEAPSTLRLGGPLFVATNGSTFNATSLGHRPATCCSAFFIASGARLEGPTSDAALIQLTNSSVIGRDGQSGGTFFHVSDRNGAVPSELVAPAMVTLGSPLLAATGSSISSLFGLFQVSRSAFSSSHSNALVQLDSSTISAGGVNALDDTLASGNLFNVSASLPTDAVRFPASASLGGPFLRAANDTQLTTTGDAIGVFNGGQLNAGSPTAALIELDNSQLTAGPSQFARSILAVNNVGGADGATRSTATLRGSLLNATNESSLNLTGGFLGLFNGGQVIVSGAAAINPLVTLHGGNHILATGSVLADPSTVATSMFDLFGRSATVERDASGVVTNADHPLRHGGPLLETSGARIAGSAAAPCTESGGPGCSQRVVRLNSAVFDSTLFEASRPLLNVTNNSLIRTATNAIDVFAARLTAAGDLVQLNASRFDVVSGALANVSGGSRFVLNGNLVSLANGSTLNLLSGPVMSVSGNSLVDIRGALIGFSGPGNTVNITNTLCAGGGCVERGGLIVHLNGAGSVAVANGITGAGTVNLSPGGAHMSVSGGSRVTIGPR